MKIYIIFSTIIMEEWDVIKMIMKEFSLSKFQVDSFNHFCSHTVSRIINNYKITIEKDDTISYIISFSNIQIYKPTYIGLNCEKQLLYPTDCIKKNLSYSGNINVDIKIIQLVNGVHKDKLDKIIHDVYIGDMPIMVYSNLCNIGLHTDNEHKIKYNHDIYDIGCYFIINGQKKILVAQEKPIMNVPISYVNNRKIKPRYTKYIEVRSVSVTSNRNTSTIVGIIDKYISLIVINIHIKDSIPIVIIFRALGIEDDYDILNYILEEDINDVQYREFLQYSFEESWEYKTKQSCVEYIYSTLIDVKNIDIDYVDYILSIELFLHLSSVTELKVIYLGYIVHELLKLQFDRKERDDRDHYRNKRCVLSDNLFEGQFSQCFRKMLKNIHKIQTKSDIYSKIINYVKPQIITIGMSSCLTSNNWLTNSGKQLGISKIYDAMNIVCTHTFTRQLAIPMTNCGKGSAPRKLHLSHCGIVCPSETPEGKSVGIIKNLAVLTHVTTGYNTTFIINILNSIPEFINCTIDINKCNDLTLCKIFINGTPYRYTEYESKCYKILRKNKRLTYIPFDTTISNFENKIFITSDVGRYFRPLFIVYKNNKIKLDKKYDTLQELLINGVIEYLDKEEEDMTNILICQSISNLNEKSLKYTHCEITPSSIYGIGVSHIPYSNHNQSPRNAYQAGMGKQAIGIPAFNYIETLNTNISILSYPERPLAMTRMSKELNYHKLPVGQNAVVYIMPYGGYNQEDSLIFNQSSVDRGFMHVIKYIVYSVDIKVNSMDDICIPMKKNILYNYDKLDDKGIIKLHSQVKYNDVVIGKVSRSNKCTDDSVIYKENISGVVHRIEEIQNIIIKIIITQSRSPGLKEHGYRTGGDKFSSRHGQKGTIGILLPSEDLPFTKDGSHPDIIINPNAFPGRMTIAQLIEMLCCKSILNSDLLHSTYFDELTVDSTPFNEIGLKSIIDNLYQKGIYGFGDECVYSGETGMKMKCLVYTGIVYYQRLKHLVIDKIHARSRGIKQTLTRQPKEGRANDGGFKIGWMESESQAANGVAYVIKDRLFEQSDKYTMIVCDKCGLQIDTDECKLCKSCDISEIEIPYGTKLVNQELVGLNLVPRLMVKQKM